MCISFRCCAQTLPLGLCSRWCLSHGVGYHVNGSWALGLGAPWYVHAMPYMEAAFACSVHTMQSFCIAGNSGPLFQAFSTQYKNASEMGFQGTSDVVLCVSPL